MFMLILEFVPILRENVWVEFSTIGKVRILREIWSYSLFFSIQILVSNIEVVLDNKCIVSGDICLLTFPYGFLAELLKFVLVFA